MQKAILAVVLALSFAPLTGCYRQGPAERAGERVDEVVDNVKEGEAPLHRKGTAEKVGESIDKTVHPDRY